MVYSYILQAIKASENFIRKFNDTNVVESLYYWSYDRLNQITYMFRTIDVELSIAHNIIRI